MQVSTRTKIADYRMSKSDQTAKVAGLPGRGAVDAALMTRVRENRDRKALADLATHYAPRLKGWLVNRGVISETAEDLVQDTLIKVWKKADKFDPQKASFSTWVYRLTRNCWIDHKRKHDRLQPTSPDVMQVLADQVVDETERNYDQMEADKAVNEALAELPPETKSMLQMSFFEGLSHSQIATRTGLPLGTVKSRIRAPLKRLQSRLEAYRGIYNA